ncbi:MAG: pyridoxal phosphate-dependent aminotransferase [Clostridiales bacterium]|jgi:aspartate aminotransferase|nr:pyridoxal phosphate-dependent aminotransferase [Clostridiales bacterium]
MKELSRIAARVQASTTLAVDSLAKQMKADGLDVIGFGTGEPDFDTPENIKEAACKAIRDGQTKYTPAGGIIPLRKAAAARLKTDCGVEYDYTQIVVASGAKHNIFVTLMALLNPGDEVILPAPYWVTYKEAVQMAGGVPVVVKTTEEARFKITAGQLEAAMTDKTKLIIINNPSNPTGMLYSGDELKKLADVCVKHDLYIISDEIYYSLVYDGRKFVSMASLGEDIRNRTIIINGVSKSYSMTGWRIGYSASNSKLAKIMENYLSHSTSAPSTISQYAALEALNGPQECVREMREVFEERRNYIVDRINAVDGVNCLKPDGAFYVMMNIEKLLGRTLGGRVINNGDDFALAFLEKGLVAVVPCSGFGAPNFVRLTYAASMNNIKEGLDRLEKFLRG